MNTETREKVRSHYRSVDLGQVPVDWAEVERVTAKAPAESRRRLHPINPYRGLGYALAVAVALVIGLGGLAIWLSPSSPDVATDPVAPGASGAAPQSR